MRWNRSVDTEGYITLHTNRYSLPASLIDREVFVHETRGHVRIFDGHALVCEHERVEAGARQRRTLPVSCASSSAGMMTVVGIRPCRRAPSPRRTPSSPTAP